jgi:putative transposase
MEKDYNTTYHRKFLVQYHIIFVCKYRKKLMIKCGNLIKRYLIEYAKTTNVIVDIAEVDKDHIHILLKLKNFRF